MFSSTGKLSGNMDKLLLTCFLSSYVAAGGTHRDFSALRPSYDYVVAGGGLSGLVVANRLTENSEGKDSCLSATA